MSVWGFIVSLFLFFFGRHIFYIFLQEPEVLILGAEYMKILAFCQIAMCLEGVGASVFRGIGETVKPSAVSIISNALRIPLAYFLSRTGLGLFGLWIGITVGACVRGGWTYIWFLIRKRTIPVSAREAVME